MQTKLWSALAASFALVMGIGFDAGAAVITVPFVDAGWYDETGFHDNTNPSHFTGEIVLIGRNAFFRSFYTFTLPAISGTIVSAKLDIFNPTFLSGDLTETLGIFDVSTPVASLSPTTSGATAIFGDLGSGTSYGSQSVSAADNGSTVTVTLNAAALAALAGANPGPFAFGGALTTLNASPSTEFVFAGTETERNVNLVITTRGSAVPEPASLTMLGVGLLAAGLVRRRFGRQSVPQKA